MTDAAAPRTKPAAQDITWEPIEGTSLQLRFSWRALAALRDLWKLPTDQAVQDHLAGLQSSGALDSSTAVDLIFASTRSKHPELSRDAVLDIFDEGGFGVAGDLSEVLGRLISGSTAEADPGARPRTAAAPTTP